MREILFRGKDNNVNGIDWVYGYYVKCESGFMGELSHLIFSGKMDYGWREESYYPTVYVKNFVDPSTVGQYTGLKDSSGKKIFEGDICDFTVFDCLDNDTQYRGVVVYAGSRFMLWKSVESEYYGADGGFDLDWVIAQDDEFEVVGNIHDTPELLEKKEA